MPIPHKPPFKYDVTITVNWEDGWGPGGKIFLNVHELADFLKENPAFAEALGYVPKKVKK